MGYRHRDFDDQILIQLHQLIHAFDGDQDPESVAGGSFEERFAKHLLSDIYLECLLFDQKHAICNWDSLGERLDALHPLL